MVEPTKVAAKAGTKVSKAASPAEPADESPAEVLEDSAEESLDEGQLEREMDRLSLEQAIRDFEIANGRVVDLTQRLISSNERAVQLQQELDRTQTALVELNSRHQEVIGSQAYRLAAMLRTVRNLLRR
jgi:hypothetical protein